MIYKLLIFSSQNLTICVALRKGNFLEDITLTVNRSGISKSHQQGSISSSGQDRLHSMYVESIQPILKRIEDIIHSRIGLFLLSFGFIIQIISQWVTGSFKENILIFIFLFISPIPYFITKNYLSRKWGEDLREVALSEYLDRILLRDGWNPSGRPHYINENVVKAFLGNNTSDDDLKYWLRDQFIQKRLISRWTTTERHPPTF